MNIGWHRIWLIWVVMFAPAVAAQGIDPALSNAIILGQQGEVQKLLSRQQDLNAATETGHTLATLAVESGNLSMVEMLLKAGADFSIVDSRDNTPALQAVRDIGGNGAEIIALLGRYQVDINRSTSLLTPLYYAVINSDTGMINALLAAGADPNARTAEGRLPLIEAIGHVPTLQQLLTAGADPNAIDRHGDPVIFSALRDSADDALEALLQAGADPTRPNAAGESALDIAQYQDNARALELLRAHGAQGAAASTTTPAAAADIGALPLHRGADTLLVQEKMAMYVTADPMPAVADSTRALFESAGWSAELTAQTDQMRHLTFTRAGQSVVAYVSVAPAQGGKTMIQYMLQ